MRFTIFGVGEGIRCDSPKPFWALLSISDIVLDASVSARDKGVRPGMQKKTAKSLVPEMEFISEEEQDVGALDRILHRTSRYTPWVQKLNEDSFIFQIPGHRPPMKEVRGILADMGQELGPEQRLQIAMAESPYLARTLVEWSRVERVPDTLYFRVHGELWLISPSIANVLHNKDDFPMQRWLAELPIPAFWIAPKGARERLMSLGVHRLKELASIPASYLERQFGKPALRWLEWLQELPRGMMKPNFPPDEVVFEWVPAAGEEAPLHAIEQILSKLSEDLEAVLQQRGAGALQLVLKWETERFTEQIERNFKQPVFDKETILPGMLAELDRNRERYERALEQGKKKVSSRQLSRVCFTAHRLQSLVSAQMQLQGASTAHKKVVSDLNRVVRHVNRKFPGRLQMGLHPTFRELRLQAVLAANGAEPAVTSRGATSSRRLWS